MLDTHTGNGYNISGAEVAQSVEQWTENSMPGMPIWVVKYKLGLLCQLPKPRFEAKCLLVTSCPFYSVAFLSPTFVPLYWPAAVW